MKKRKTNTGRDALNKNKSGTLLFRKSDEDFWIYLSKNKWLYFSKNRNGYSTIINFAFADYEILKQNSNYEFWEPTNLKK